MLLSDITDMFSAKPFCTFSAPDLDDRPYRITSLNYSTDGQEILVSYSSDHLYLFGIQVSSQSAYGKIQLFAFVFNAFVGRKLDE